MKENENLRKKAGQFKKSPAKGAGKAVSGQGKLPPKNKSGKAQGGLREIRYDPKSARQKKLESAPSEIIAAALHELLEKRKEQER